MLILFKKISPAASRCGICSSIVHWINSMLKQSCIVHSMRRISVGGVLVLFSVGV